LDYIANAYRWSSIVRSSLFHGTAKHQLKHFFYAGGWKRFEPLWNMVIQLRKLNLMTPLLEGVLSKITRTPDSPGEQFEPVDERAASTRSV